MALPYVGACSTSVPCGSLRSVLERPARTLLARLTTNAHAVSSTHKRSSGDASLRVVTSAVGSSGSSGVTADQLAPRNLVIAVDSSEDSVAAFKWALHNLYRTGDALHILHVLPDTGSSPASGSLHYPSASTEEELSQVLQQADEFIQSEFVGLAAKKGVDVNVVLVKDSRHKHIGWAVCRKAEELQAAPLVLATHHKGYFAEMLLGSVSKFCATHCKQPVLLVHPDHSQVAW